MAKRAQEGLSPRPFRKGEFDKSNVFVAYSRKVEREIKVIGPANFDAWLSIEFDVDIDIFCERPPLDLALMPVKEGKHRPYDFWVRHRRGRQHGLIVYDPQLPRDRRMPIELLKRSAAEVDRAVEIWLASDLRARSTLIRNLKQLQPYVSMDAALDSTLRCQILECVNTGKEITWSDVLRDAKLWYEGSINAELARLIHSGRVGADLSQSPLSMSTRLNAR